MINLTTQSIRYFMPDIPIYCFTFYKDKLDPTQPPLLPFITEYVIHSKYGSNKDVHDHVDPSQTSGFANKDNGLYFCEGFNAIFNKFKTRNEKVIMLAEDHYTTKGEWLKELNENDWDVAFASAFNPDSNANASILGINPAKVAHLFPLPETNKVPIETTLTKYLIKKVKTRSKLYQIKCRQWIDYKGDGQYTNSSEVIEADLKERGIL